jgi:hypothetical protein
MAEATRLRVGLGHTLNLGNFESLRTDVSIEDSVRAGESIDEAYERVWAYVEAKLLKAVNDARAEIEGGK